MTLKPEISLCTVRRCIESSSFKPLYEYELVEPTIAACREFYSMSAAPDDVISIALFKVKALDLPSNKVVLANIEGLGLNLTDRLSLFLYTACARIPYPQLGVAIIATIAFIRNKDEHRKDKALCFEDTIHKYFMFGLPSVVAIILAFDDMQAFKLDAL